MFPLSRSQEIVWLHEQLFPDSRAYNFTGSMELRGPLDEPALRRSLSVVVDRHDAFRLELDPGAFPPRQRVRPRCAPRYRTVDLTGAPDPEAAFDELWRRQHDEPFDTAQAPMVRWTVVRMGPDRHRLLQTEHHLVHDGWSFALVLRDLFTTYREVAHGTPAALPAPGSYAEHAQKSAADGADGPVREEALAYWRSQLREAPFDLPLPGHPDADRGRRAPHGAQQRLPVSPDRAAGLRSTAQRHGVTPFSVLLTLFAELLRRFSGRTDLVIGSAVGNRPPGTGETVGMFVNTIPLRLRLRPGRSARESVEDTTDVLLRALPHQHVPVQELTRELGLHSAGGLDTPLFRVMFSAHDAPLPEIPGLDLDVTVHEGYNTGTSRFDLDVVLIPDARRTVNSRTGTDRDAAGMLLVWDYARDLWDGPAIGGMHDRLMDLLDTFLHTPDTPLAHLAPQVDGASPLTDPNGERP